MSLLFLEDGKGELDIGFYQNQLKRNQYLFQSMLKELTRKGTLYYQIITKLMKKQKWSQWQDVGVRTDYRGRDYLLQMRTRFSDNKKIFKNRSLDSAFGGYLLFHGKEIFNNLKELLKIK